MQPAEQFESRPIESVEEMVSYFHAFSKPSDAWRVGTEHELIGVSMGIDDFARPLPYEGTNGIRAVLESLTTRPFRSWQPVYEGDNVIALTRDDAAVTLEPGGQLELSGRPAATAAETAEDLELFLCQLSEPSRRLGIAWLGVGFRPFGVISEVPWMPKGRYQVMRDYLPQRGHLAREMMQRTATVQVNLDYGGPDDAHRKLRCAMGVSSILTAIYANSPIVDGEVSGYQSYRAHIWQHTDPDRCGLLPFVFDDGDIFSRYVEWVLDVPMFFVQREHSYLPTGGLTFRQFMREGFAGQFPTMDDWVLHLSTVFPEVRLKPFIEMRGCDAGSGAMVLALPPLSRGLLYDADACQAATELTEGLDFTERLNMARDVGRMGLAAPVGSTGHTVGDLAVELIAIADAGLQRVVPNERDFLDPLRQVVDDRRTPADAMIELWRRVAGDPARVIAEVAHSYPNCPAYRC